MDKRSNKRKLILLGAAGNYGKEFTISSLFLEYKAMYDEVVICDRNDRVKSINGIVNKGDYDWAIDENTSVLIVSGAWYSLYQECIIHGIRPIGIYGLNGKINDLYSMCLDCYHTYLNDKAIIYYNGYEHKIDNNCKRFLHGEELSDCITEIGIEISNQCNYAQIHTKCPANRACQKIIMSKKEVYSIIDMLSEMGFDGIISFKGYNEPTNDPRLFLFIEYAKKRIPQSDVLIYTNGYYLNETMINDYLSSGVGLITATAYGENEHIRLLGFHPEVPYMVFAGKLDERMDIYERDAKINNQKCRSWVSSVNVSCTGELGLCCLDYKYKYHFGNVFREGIRTILNQQRIREIQTQLLKGDRTTIPLCQRCGWSR